MLCLCVCVSPTKQKLVRARVCVYLCVSFQIPQEKISSELQNLNVSFPNFK